LRSRTALLGRLMHAAYGRHLGDCLDERPRSRPDRPCCASAPTNWLLKSAAARRVLDYPAMRARYERDMDTVNRARALLDQRGAFTGSRRTRPLRKRRLRRGGCSCATKTGKLNGSMLPHAGHLTGIPVRFSSFASSM
jgi:hypothetical protein